MAAANSPEGAAASPRVKAAGETSPKPSADTNGVTPGADAKDWDVVPVFYGTDREREPNPKRISYSSDRGLRMFISGVH